MLIKANECLKTNINSGKVQFQLLVGILTPFQLNQMKTGLVNINIDYIYITTLKEKPISALSFPAMFPNRSKEMFDSLLGKVNYCCGVKHLASFNWKTNNNNY